MYNQQETALKIKSVAKERKMSIKTLLDKCDLNINYISDLSKGNDTMISNIYKIANCLNVSVDYLLGRSEQPTQITNNHSTISGTGAQAQNCNITVSDITGIEKEILNEMKKMNNKEKAKLLLTACEMTEKESH